MSTVQVLPQPSAPEPARGPSPEFTIEEMRRLAEQDDCIVNRQGGPQALIRGICLGIVLWAGCILAFVAMFRH